MYGKALFFVVLVVVGAVLPYILADEKWLANIESWLDAKIPSELTEAEPISPAFAKPTTAGKPIPIPAPQKFVQPPGARPHQNELAGTSGISAANPLLPTSSEVSRNQLVGPPCVPIEHLLSFEVTPEWVRENWARVTTNLAELELQGWRVPVCLDDVYAFAGSVTYYFDRQRKTQRILLHGYTKDPSNLVQLATSRYRMQRIPNTLSELYSHSVEGKVLAGLQIKGPSFVQRTSSGGTRNEVVMELNRIGSPYGLSYEFEQILGKNHTDDQNLSPIPKLDLDALKLSPITDKLPAKPPTSPRSTSTSHRSASESQLFDDRSRNSSLPESSSGDEGGIRRRPLVRFPN